MKKLLAILCLLALALDAKSATTYALTLDGANKYWSPFTAGGALLTSMRAYVDPINGNDATGTVGDASKPFLTITNAVTAANPIGTAGTNIVVIPAPAIYDLGPTNTIRLSNNVSIIGYGRFTTKIYGSAPGSVSPLIVPGNNSIIGGIGIYQTNVLTAAMAFGTASDGASTNVVVGECYFRGGSDMIYLSHLVPCYWSFFNCSGLSDWDCVAIVSGTTNHVINLFNADFTSDQRNAAWGPSGSPTHCLLADAGTINVFGGRLTLYGTNSGIHAIARTRTADATIVFAGGTFFDPVSTTPLIIRNDGAGTNIAQNAIELNQISGAVVWKTTNVVANSVTSSRVLTLNATNEVIVATGGGQGGVVISNALPRIKLQRTDGSSAGYFRSLFGGQFEIEIENTALSLNWNTNGLTYIEMMSLANMSTNVAFKIKTSSANGPFDVINILTNGTILTASSNVSDIGTALLPYRTNYAKAFTVVGSTKTVAYAENGLVHLDADRFRLAGANPITTNLTIAGLATLHITNGLIMAVTGP